MENEELFEVDTFTLTAEDGTEQEFGILDMFEVEGKQYIAVSEITDDALSEEIILLTYAEEGEDMIVGSIEEDDEYEAVEAAYLKMIDDELENCQED